MVAVVSLGVALLDCGASRAAVRLADGLPQAPKVSASGGTLAWSAFDGTVGMWRLMVRRDGVTQTLPIVPRATPFDVDLGEDGYGGLVASTTSQAPSPGAIYSPLYASEDSHGGTTIRLLATRLRGLPMQSFEHGGLTAVTAIRGPSLHSPPGDAAGVSSKNATCSQLMCSGRPVLLSSVTGLGWSRRTAWTTSASSCATVTSPPSSKTMRVDMLSLLRWAVCFAGVRAGAVT
ncbi:MAG: hypothetical protein WA484_00280 [Solirubrobacteraceae bacterium]